MTVTLTINGQRVTAPEGSTILEAARGNGIRIPTLCHHPDLSNVGACRLCVVSVERARGLQTACTTPVFEGMVVNTESEDARATRQVRAQRAAHRSPERLHALRGQRRVRAAGPGLRVRRRVARPRRRAARVPGRSRSQPVHLHRSQQVHPVHPLRARVRARSRTATSGTSPAAASRASWWPAPTRTCSTRPAKAAASAWPTARSARCTTR